MQAAARTITPAIMAVFLSMVNCAIDRNIRSVFVPWLLLISICGMLSRERMAGVRMIVRMKETMIPNAQKKPSSASPLIGWEIIVTKPTITVTAEIRTGEPIEMMQFPAMHLMASRVNGPFASCTSS